MEIQINQTISGFISKEQMKEITIKYLEDMHDVKAHYYIKDNNLMKDIETAYASRCVTDEVVIREATENDAVIIALLRNIMKNK